MSALGQKRTSANKLRSCPTCFSWAVLQALQRFGNGLVEIGLEIGRGLHDGPQWAVVE
jgi:hypothetical protein